MLYTCGRCLSIIVLCGHLVSSVTSHWCLVNLLWTCSIKRLRGYLDLSYHDRLNKLNLETLELRRVKSDLVLCYKVIFDIVHLNKHDFFDISTTTTSGHQFKIYKRFNSCSVRSHFFCERVVNIWNRLPVDSTDFGSLHRFSNSLDAIDDKILVDAQ